MAETLARKGYLTLLKLGNDASPQIYTAIAEVVSIDGFGFTAAELLATHMESPDGYNEYVAGMKDGDTVTVMLNMIRENFIQTKAVWDAGLRRDFRIEWPGDIPNNDFSAVPLAWHARDATPNTVLKVEVTMRISGSILSSN